MRGSINHWGGESPLPKLAQHYIINKVSIEIRLKIVYVGKHSICLLSPLMSYGKEVS